MRISNSRGKATAVFAQSAAGIGRRKAARAAVQQLDAVQGFEAVDVLADRRRSHAQRGSGSVHAAVFEDGGENK